LIFNYEALQCKKICDQGVFMYDYCELDNELTLTSINQFLVTDEAVFQALSNLHIENNPFEFYDLGLSDEDKLFLSTVKVAKNDSELIGAFDQENNFFYLKDLKNKSKIAEMIKRTETLSQENLMCFDDRWTLHTA